MTPEVTREIHMAEEHGMFITPIDETPQGRLKAAVSRHWEENSLRSLSAVHHAADALARHYKTTWDNRLRKLLEAAR